MTLPINFVNGDLQATTHPAAHNNANAAINSLSTRMTAAEGSIALMPFGTRTGGGTRWLRVDNSGHITWSDAMEGPAGPAGADGTNGSDGADGADGAAGADGAPGAPGAGVAAGGTTGQVLKKSSNADYATEWGDAASGLPTQTDQAGKYLTTNGTVASWAVVDAGAKAYVGTIASLVSGDTWSVTVAGVGALNSVNYTGRAMAVGDTVVVADSNTGIHMIVSRATAGIAGLTPATPVGALPTCYVGANFPQPMSLTSNRVSHWSQLLSYDTGTAIPWTTGNNAVPTLAYPYASVSASTAFTGTLPAVSAGSNSYSYIWWHDSVLYGVIYKYNDSSSTGSWFKLVAGTGWVALANPTGANSYGSTDTNTFTYSPVDSKVYRVCSRGWFERYGWTGTKWEYETNVAPNSIPGANSITTFTANAWGACIGTGGTAAGMSATSHATSVNQRANVAPTSYAYTGGMCGERSQGSDGTMYFVQCNTTNGLRIVSISNSGVVATHQIAIAANVAATAPTSTPSVTTYVQGLVGGVSVDSSGHLWFQVAAVAGSDAVIAGATAGKLHLLTVSTAFGGAPEIKHVGYPRTPSGTASTDATTMQGEQGCKAFGNVILYTTSSTTNTNVEHRCLTI